MSHFRSKQVNGITYYGFEEIDRLEFVTHAFSTRRSGITPFPSSALNLGYISQDTKENVHTNRLRFVSALAWPPEAIRELKQIHSNTIHTIAKDNASIHVFEGDGLLTALPGLLLAVQTADCLPIMMIDPTRRLIANVHAGWRGSAARIAERAVGLMTEQCGSKPQDLWAAMGPGIGACCYEVGEEVYERFRSTFGYSDHLFHRPPGKEKRHLNLVEANARQLKAHGLSEDRILKADLCTVCRNDLFFSHRFERGNTGRMMSVIGIKN